MADRRARFVETYLPYAQEASRLTGIDPGVILAQAAHETGWGRKAPGNNFFGIKGKGQTFATHEYVGGKRVNTKAGFRSYADPRDSFLDWAKLMHNPRYAGVLAATTPEEQIKALKAAGYATDPFYVRKLSNVREQVADLGGAIQTIPPDAGGIADVAALNPPPDAGVGSTDLQGFAPNLPEDPAQAAIAENFGQSGDLTADQIDELTRTDVAGNYLNPLTAGRGRSIPLQLPPQWTPAPGFPQPQPQRPGPGGALGVDLGMQPAGMPVPPPRPSNMPLPPSRPGTFDWMGGGAPAAGMVPTPGASPLRPAAGGPNDRRPTPPMPQQRPYTGPMPPMRPAGAAAVANMPGMVAPQDDGRAAAIQSVIDQGVTDPNAIWGTLNMDRDGNLVGDITQAEIQTVLDQGQRNAPDAQSAIADAFGPGTPFSQAPPPSAPQPSGLTGGLTGGRGDVPGQMPAAPFQTPYGGRPEAAGALPAAPPPPLPTWDANQSRLQSDALARDLGFNRRQMEGLTQSPPSAASMANMPGVAAQGPPNFASADPSTMLPPSWSPATSFPAADTHRSGEWFTPAPPMPAPVADANAGRFDAFDMPSGQIMDLQTAFDSRAAPPSPTYPSPFGITPAYADDDALISGGGGTDFLQGGNASTFDPGRFDAAGPAKFAPGPGQALGKYDPLTGTYTPDPAMDLSPDVQKAATTPTTPTAPAVAPAPDVTAAPAAATPAKATAEKKDVSTVAKTGLLSVLLGPVGAAIAAAISKGGGTSGSGTGFGAGFAPAAYTPYSAQSPGWVNGMMSTPTLGGNLGNFRTSGSAPYGPSLQPKNWTSGTSNALGGSNALQWTGSNGQTITAYTDPATGTTFHSFS